jgi:hypothetical protein
MAGPYPTPDLLARRRFLNDATTRSISTSSATTTLTEGVWELTSDIDCFFKQGPVASVTAGSATASVPLWAKSYVEVYVSGESDTGLAVTCTSGAGTLYAIKLS